MNMIHFYRFFFLHGVKRNTRLLLLCLLTGCAALNGANYDPQVYWAHRERNQNLQAWRVLATVHVKAQNASSAFLVSWVQKQDTFDIFLIPPGKQKADAHIVGKVEEAELVLFERKYIKGEETVEIKERHPGNQVDQLVLDKLHLLFPVSGLTYWLRGLAKPNVRAPFSSVGNDNRLDYLMQEAWDVTYISYKKHEGYQLPEKIKLASHQVKGFTIEMEIIRWEMGDAISIN